MWRLLPMPLDQLSMARLALASHRNQYHHAPPPVAQMVLMVAAECGLSAGRLLEMARLHG